MSNFNTKSKLKVAFLLDKTNYTKSFHPDDIEFFKTFANILNEGMCPDKVDEKFMIEALEGAEACVTCWGTPLITGKVLEHAPDLKLIAHAAGTPKAVITDAVWEREIRVFTAAPVIAIDVAETTLGAIITSLKHLVKFDKIVRSGTWTSNKTAVMSQMKRLNYRLTVGIISASHVGRHLVRFLKPFGAKIKLYDPLISDFEAMQLGIEKVTLEKLMSESDVVTVHSPNIPATKNLVSKEMLSLMKDGSLFVNTARAAVVDEEALIKELETGRIYAYIDVFNKEPLPNDSPFLKLENVLLSPHISGGHTINGSYERGRYVIEQLYSYYYTGKIKDEVVRDMLETMA